MDFKKISDKHKFQLYVNLCLGIFITLSSYIHVPLSSIKDYIIYAAHFILLQITLYGFTYLLTLNKWLFRIIFSFLFVSLSIISFWIYTLDITISVDLIQLSLESKPDIYLDLVSLQLIIYLVVVLITLFSILKLHSKINWAYNKKIKIFIFPLIAITLFFSLEKIKFGVLTRRMPYVVVLESIKYFNKKPLKINTIHQKLRSDTKINIVFVLGESVRAKNLQINGYSRPTNPLLSKRNDIYSFKNIYTPNTYTSKSVPQILTSKSVNDTVNKSVYALYSVLNKANYHTVWLGNQTPEVSYRDLIYQNNIVSLIDVEHSVLSYHKKYDGELLSVFKDNYTRTHKNMYTIHMIGSHWWYENRYPKEFKVFTPVVKSKYLPSNTKEEIINSYDNTVVYLDYFLNDIISFLEKKHENIVMIYLSDHGEILGEDDKWLHAQNHNASKNPACIIWCSKSFQQNYKKKVKFLEQNTGKKISTDFLYPSVLDLIDLESFEYNTHKSIFSNNP